MKIDTSSYYPKSPLGDDEDDGVIESHRAFMPGNDVPPAQERQEESEPAATESATGAQTATVTEQQSDPNDDDRTQTQQDIGLTDAESSVLDGISTFLSWALVPLLMPVYGILLAFHLSMLRYVPSSLQHIFTGVVGLITLVVPMLAVILLKYLGIVKDVGLNGRRERLIPYLITILSLAGTAVFFMTKHAPSWLVMFYFGGAAAGVVNLIINFKWKISAHSAGIAGIVALLIRIMHSDMPQPDIVIWLMVVIGLSGLLGSARVWLGRHTVWQVLAGYAVGFCVVFFMTLIKY